MDERAKLLLESAESLTGDLDLDQVLHRIVEAARRLAPCRYAALGIADENGGIERFVYSGMGAEEAAEIGGTPRGRGLLGALLRRPDVVRLEDLTTHPAAAGFPDGHPEMRTFLGTPVLVGDKIYGNLYLTEKVGGEGFSEADEHLVLGLAAAAGVAIHQARVLHEGHRREAELVARGEITSALLRGRPAREVLGMAVERARDLTRAAAAVLLVVRGNSVAVAAAADHMDSSLVGMALHVDPDRVMSLRGDLENPEDLALLEPLLSHLNTNAVHAASATFAGQRHGVVLLARSSGGEPLPDDDAEVLRALADLAAIVLGHEQNRLELQRLAVLDDRSRIARDLHDTVIQRLFTIGLDAQGVASRLAPEHPETAAEIGGITEQLDDVISEIRTAIFMLRRGPVSERSFREQLVTLLAESRRALGFEPALAIEGPIDTVCSPSLCEEVLTSVREMLANVARHANATRAWVRVQADGRELTAEVRDDGLGFDPDGTQLSGLDNLSARAGELGGQLVIQSGNGGGTRLRWQVPVS